MNGTIRTAKTGESPSREPLAADHHFLFKPLPGVQNGGCRLEVWLPESSWGAPLPIALMFHGGGWLLGSADMVPYNQVRYLLNAGVAVVSCEYRMLPHFVLGDIREDLLDAYKYVQKQINVDLLEAGAIYTLDGSRTCALGWSAGASNVLWLAQEVHRYNSRSHQDQLPPLRALIPTYPLTKLDAQKSSRAFFSEYSRLNQEALRFSAEQAMKDLLAQRPSASYKVHPLFIVQRHSAINPAMVADFEGLNKEDATVACASQPPPRLKVAFALMMSECLCAYLLDRDPAFDPEDSPINFIRPDFPPTVVVSAGADTLIPVHHSHDLFRRLQEHKVHSILLEAEGMAHGEAECLSGSSWDSAWWESALRPSLDFALDRLGVRRG